MSINNLIKTTTKYLSKLASYIEKDILRQGIDKHEDRLLLYMESMEKVRNAHNRLCNTVKEVGGIEPEKPVITRLIGIDVIETVIGECVGNTDIKVVVERRSQDTLKIDFYYMGNTPYYDAMDRLRLLELDEHIGGKIKYFKPRDGVKRLASLRIRLSDFISRNWIMNHARSFLQATYPNNKVEVVLG